MTDPNVVAPGSGADAPWPEGITTLRASQVTAAEQIRDAFESGKRIVVVEAPTGAGKTVIGELARRQLKTQALYVCTDKMLQDQLGRTFPYARILKGRKNYGVIDDPEHTAEDCNVSDGDSTLLATCATCIERNVVLPPVKHCSYCHPVASCPYRLAKRAARAAQLGCTNLSYLLTEANGPGEFSDWDLIIADECDRLEGALMGHVSVVVSRTRWEHLGVTPPAAATDAPGWGRWIKLIAQPAVAAAIARLEEDDEASAKALEQLRDFEARLEQLLPELHGWRWVAVPNPKGGTEFKPVRVRRQAPELLWRHAERWLLMSATVLDAERLLWTLGADTEPWAFVEVPSSFDVARRPLILSPVADVTHKNPAAPTALAKAVRTIGARHPNERILVHTVSHRLAQELWTLLGGERSRRAVLLRPGMRDEAIAEYLAKPDGVLIAAGLERGVDFKDDECRVVVVAKCPWPDLSDPQVAARQRGAGTDDIAEAREGRTWYAQQALRAVVQMTGRGMRHEGDACTTYLLDQQLLKLLDLRLPTWWRAAVRAEPL